jgi:hypothetical protein
MSLLDTRLSASKDSLERGKSRRKHIGQQPTQCKRLSDHPIKTGGMDTIQFLEWSDNAVGARLHTIRASVN